AESCTGGHGRSRSRQPDGKGDDSQLWLFGNGAFRASLGPAGKGPMADGSLRRVQGAVSQGRFLLRRPLERDLSRGTRASRLSGGAFRTRGARRKRGQVRL